MCCNLQTSLRHTIQIIECFGDFGEPRVIVNVSFLTDYLHRTYLLQSKDKLITSLREGGEGGVGSDVSAGITAEIEQEKSLLRQELHQSASTV